MADRKKPKVQLADPVETLVDAFNKRTEELHNEAQQVNTTYTAKLEELKKSFDKSARNSERVMIAVIVVLALGFISLVVALVAIITSSWQAKSEAEANTKQAPNIEKMLENQQKILDRQDTLQGHSSTQNQPIQDSKQSE